MNFEPNSRDPFEEFGDFGSFEGFGEIESPKTAQLREIDLAPARIETDEPEAPYKPPSGFSWASFAGGLAALTWIGAAIGGPISYFGLDAVMAMDPAMQAGLIALACGPALLFWLGAAAAGEAARTRRLTLELTQLTRNARAPIEAGEAQRLSLNVKTEIQALNGAVVSALGRLSELETAAQRNTALFDGAIAATRENAQFMAGHLEHERGALIALNGELRGQTETMAHSIGRQIRLMREASKLVKTEITAAEDALETHLASFAASASMMAERTASFHLVADGAASATAELNTTMGHMLDGLGEATRLTDAARQSAEQAVLAANETATAVRDTTRHAVFEAKRAAQAIRAETAALQDSAAATLSRLQSAAHAAREASDESQAAADRHALSIEKRLSALATAAGAKPPVNPRKGEHASAPSCPQPTAANDGSPATRRPHVRAVTPANEPRHDGGGGFSGRGGWSNFIPSKPRAETSSSPRAATAPQYDSDRDLVEFAPRKKGVDAVLKADAIDLVLAAGVGLGSALSPSALEVIAQSSRKGAAARRQAVTNAAPAAVGRIARHVERCPDAQIIAAEFRARPDLAKGEKKGETSELVRAYLLIDAALA